MNRRNPTLSLALLALIAGGAAAQDPAPEPDEARERELIRPIMESPTVDPAQQMIELFHRVERNLVEVDGLLYDASAGEGALSDALKDSGMGDLLRGGMERSEGAIETIDEILALAQDQGGSVGSCMKANEQGGEGSPLDQQQGSPQDREQTPERPQGDQQDPQQQESNRQQSNDPNEGGEEPDQEPENREASPPAARATEPGATPFGQDQWGDLPEHVREVFRTEGQSDMPPQYRDWIEAYYRRLNTRRDR